MSDRGEEIERLFWLLLRLCGLFSGYLLVAGGGLFALAFVVEQLRTGAITLNGASHSAIPTRIWLTAVPVAAALFGAALVRLARRGHEDAAQ